MPQKKDHTTKNKQTNTRHTHIPKATENIPGASVYCVCMKMEDNELLNTLAWGWWFGVSDTTRAYSSYRTADASCLLQVGFKWIGLRPY